VPKVLRIINRFNLGGPTYNVAYLSKFLSSNYETLLVGGQKDESEDSSEFILEKYDLKPIIVDEMMRELDIKNDWKAYWKIRKIIEEYKPDIVHTHAAKAGTVGRLAAYHCKVPVIIHTFHGHVFHSYFGKLKTLFFKTIERFLAARSTVIIAISEKQKEELSLIHKIAKPEKFRIVRLGFDLQKFQDQQAEKRKSFRDKYLLDEEEIAIGIIGRLVPVKNHHLFFDAIKHVAANTHKKVRAFIIGDGESREELLQYCTDSQLKYVEFLKVEEKSLITFTSWIKDVDWALAGLDIVCLTSFNEGTPVSLIEAQAANKPIVSTKVGGIENVVLENETAFLHAIDDAQGFNSSLLKLVDDELLRQQMSKKGWEFVRDNYHYTRLVRDMESLYDELLSKKN
jgi:glycosyltransferase involved in cell wall biosynthesis